MAASRSGDSNPRSSVSNPATTLDRSAESGQSSRRAKRPTRKSRATQSQPDARAFRPQQPLWLNLLLWTQRGSSVMTLMLGAAILVTYGWTVYIQQQWGREFDRLEAMKKQERQLVSTNEVLKNQMAEQAEKPTAGLLLPDPSNAIFLTPAPQRPDVKASPTPPAEAAPTRPLGY